MNERREQFPRSRRAVILPADRRIVEAYTAYFDRIDSQGICPSLEPAVDYWGESFLDGLATQEQLAEAAKHILAVSNALKSLPDKLRSDVETQHGDYHHADKIGVVLMDPDYFPQMPTVVELITAGVPPTDDIRSSLRRRPGLMKPITDFSRTLFPLSEEGIDLLPITVPLIEQTLTSYFPRNYPGVTSLFKKAEYIMAVYRAGFPFLQSLNSKHAHFLFWYLCTNNEMLEYGPEVATLLDHHIFPTDVLTDFLRKNPDGLAKLKELQETTATGHFDPQNLPQKHLEFTKYLQIGGDDRRFSLKNFIALDFIESETSSLTKTEQIEAEVAALEAAKLYWLVRKQIEAGRKVAVVGNERYGWLFVVEPLRGMLENMGVRVGKCRVSSGDDALRIPDLPRLADFITSQKPDDIIIVDGTSTPIDQDGKARFPRAMAGFVNWFAKNTSGFAISHWLPYKASHITIGHFADFEISPVLLTTDHPQLILANPTHPQNSPLLPPELRNHQPAYFDDPDGKAANRAKIAFTPFGLRKLYSDKTEETLVTAVQQYMGLVLEEMIEKTDPKLSPQ